MTDFLDTFNRAPKRSRFSFVDSGALVDVRKSLSTRKSNSFSEDIGGQIPTSPIASATMARKISSSKLGGTRASSLVSSRGSMPPGWEKLGTQTLAIFTT